MDEVKNGTRTGKPMPSAQLKPFKARIFDAKTLSISPEFTVTGIKRDVDGSYWFRTDQGEFSVQGVFDALHTKDVEARLLKVHAALQVLKPAYTELYNALGRASIKLVPTGPLETNFEAVPEQENTNSSEMDTAVPTEPSKDEEISN